MDFRRYDTKTGSGIVSFAALPKLREKQET